MARFDIVASPSEAAFGFSSTASLARSIVLRVGAFPSKHETEHTYHHSMRKSLTPQLDGVLRTEPDAKQDKPRDHEQLHKVV